ncbi:MAG: DUF86 domain-containing protein [Methanoregulaceae archaeon]
MSEKRPAALLLFDMAEAIGKIEEYTQDISFEQLMDDERTKDAILRNIQIIGEASKHIPDSLVKSHPYIDWSGIAGIRDIVTHRYFRVDWQLLWTSIREELPLLEQQIRNLMKEESGA